MVTFTREGGRTVQVAEHDRQLLAYYRREPGWTEKTSTARPAPARKATRKAAKKTAAKPEPSAETSGE